MRCFRSIAMDAGGSYPFSSGSQPFGRLGQLAGAGSSIRRVNPAGTKETTTVTRSTLPSFRTTCVSWPLSTKPDPADTSSGAAGRIVGHIERRRAGLDDHQARPRMAVPAERRSRLDRVLQHVEIRCALRLEPGLPEVRPPARVDVGLRQRVEGLEPPDPECRCDHAGCGRRRRRKGDPAIHSGTQRHHRARTHIHFALMIPPAFELSLDAVPVDDGVLSSGRESLRDSTWWPRWAA